MKTEKTSPPLGTSVSLTFRLTVLMVELMPDPPNRQWDHLWAARFKIVSDESLPLHEHPAQPHNASHKTYLEWKASPPSFNHMCKIMYGRPETTKVSFSNMGATELQLEMGALAGMNESPVVHISDLGGKLRILWSENPLLAALLEANNDELLRTHFRAK